MGVRKITVTKELVEHLFASGVNAVDAAEPVKLRVLDVRNSHTVPRAIEILVESEKFGGGSDAGTIPLKWAHAEPWNPPFKRRE